MAVKQIITKNVNITNQINDENGYSIVTQTASIDANFNLNLSKYISNYDLYFKNKTEIRTLLSDFEDDSYAEAERMKEEAEAKKETTESTNTETSTAKAE